MKYVKKFSTDADYQAFTEGGGYVTPNVCYVEETNGIIVKPYYDNPYHITVESVIIEGGSEQSTLLTTYLLEKYGYNFNGYPENCEIRINGYEISYLHIITSSSNLTQIQGILGSNMGEFATYDPFEGYSPEWYVIFN